MSPRPDEDDIEKDEESPVEQVRLVVSNDDDPSLPVWTFRMWFLGIISCAMLAFLNTFFGFRTQPLYISMISVQVAMLPIGRFFAKVLPTNTFKIPGFGDRKFSLNPGPFNIKEHVLISIFASSGGVAYAVGIVTIIKAFYHRQISFVAGWILVITTQVLGYGWAGILRKYVVDPPHMWWPGSLAQVSLFSALHEKDHNRMSRGKFFLIALICSFSWYVFPGYLFQTLSSISILCYAFPTSVTAQQIGSGMRGLGILSFTADWSTVASYLGSPLVSPFFATANIAVGYVLVMYILAPMAYWGVNWYEAKTFPFFSSHLFNHNGELYNVSAIVNEKFEIDIPMYEQMGSINMSTFFALCGYGVGFAAIISTLTHVALFNGKQIYDQFMASKSIKADIHTKMMRKYPDIPKWWFHILLIGSLIASLFLCIFMKNDVQMPWWGLIFAAGIAFLFTLPISIIAATANQAPGLNIITEYIMGVILPGRPIANVCFKTYGYISMAQAVTFLSDFKLGHYMKIPPRSMFLVQFLGTMLAGSVNMVVAWWLLSTIPNVCNDELLPPNSPWTCPGTRVFYDASVIWGLVGPIRVFGSLGKYSALNWFFLGGAIAPLTVWICHKAFPSAKWIKSINIPVLLGATAAMPPATSVNFTSWLMVGTISNFFVFRYRKTWWQRYNYILSGAMDAGLAFMGVCLYFGLSYNNIQLDWWGTRGEHCPLATCPTAKGVVVDGCPVF